MSRCLSIAAAATLGGILSGVEIRLRSGVAQRAHAVASLHRIRCAGLRRTWSTMTGDRPRPR